jgi:signal transduction histidine kinase
VKPGFWIRSARTVTGLLAINGAFALASVVGREFPPSATWWTIANAALPGFIISTTISSLCVLTLGRIAPALFHRAKPLVVWTTLVGMLVLLAGIGTFIAIVGIAALGYIPARRAAILDTFQETFRTAVIITLAFGVLTILYEAMRARLADATLALRTKERDEAEARRIASEAERASLEARVNPHFFFNTLNSIAALTREDPERAERVTTQLASLMRSSLDQGSAALVPLEQELKTVGDYLEIEQVRFAERLRYDIEVAEGTRGALIPRLALQTLVENAVKYAVSVRPEGASVIVAARTVNGRAHVEVRDDGPGFDPASVPGGHGLALLRARLAMTFGRDAALHVTSQPGRTVALLDLPMHDLSA